MPTEEVLFRAVDVTKDESDGGGIDDGVDVDDGDNK